MLVETLSVMAQALLIYLAVDLIAGVFHWAEDTLGKPTSPIWGPAFVAPNVIHHDKPNEMNKIHWFRNNLPVYVAALVILGVAWAMDTLVWQVWWFCFVGLFSQQSHRWSHTPRKALPAPVLYLQRMRILQDGKHHWKHHRGDHSTHYCVVTPWVNPVLDRIGFWRVMERIFVPIFGAPRRPDLSDRGWYRDRAAWAA